MNFEIAPPPDVGPKPNVLINKFKDTRTMAWLIFLLSAGILVGLLVWLIIDATRTKQNLSDFELGFVASCPASSSQNGVILKVLFCAAALIGTAIGLVVLSANPFDIKRILG